MKSIASQESQGSRLVIKFDYQISFQFHIKTLQESLKQKVEFNAEFQYLVCSYMFF